jgi:mRNA interferase MazF
MKRGDVILVRWLYSDGSGSKLRPAIVVQIDALNALIADTVLVQITGTSRNAQTEVVLDPAAEPASGLRYVSYAVCNNLLTIDQSRVVRQMGRLSATAMQEIDDRLRYSLGLP